VKISTDPEEIFRCVRSRSAVSHLPRCTARRLQHTGSNTRADTARQDMTSGDDERR
jgi:hypothetical protein